MPAVVLMMGMPQLIPFASLVEAPVEYHHTGLRKKHQVAASFSRSASDSSPKNSMKGYFFASDSPMACGVPTSRNFILPVFNFTSSSQSIPTPCRLGG